MKFLNFTKTKPKRGAVYAVHKGTYLGSILIFVNYDKLNDIYQFISIKNLENVDVPGKDFVEGIKNDLLRPVKEKIPKEILVTCYKQHKYNIDHPKKANILNEDEDFNSGL